MVEFVPLRYDSTFKRQIRSLYKVYYENKVNFIKAPQSNSQKIALFFMPATGLRAHVSFDNVSISVLTFKLI